MSIRIDATLNLKLTNGRAGHVHSMYPYHNVGPPSDVLSSPDVLQSYISNPNILLDTLTKMNTYSGKTVLITGARGIAEAVCHFCSPRTLSLMKHPLTARQELLFKRRQRNRSLALFIKRDPRCLPAAQLNIRLRQSFRYPV